MSDKPIKVRDGRTKGHFWASNALIRRDGATLGVYGIAVYCALATYADNTTQDAYPSVNTLAKTLGCSTRKVRYSLKQLAELGWIEIEHRTDDDNPKRNYSNIYRLLDTPDAQETPPTAPDAQGGTAQDAGGTAPHADELHSPNIHSEKNYLSGADAPDAPTPVAECGDNTAEKRKKPNGWGDILVETAEVYNLPIGKAAKLAEQLTGTAPDKGKNGKPNDRGGENNCNPPAAPGDVREFARWYKRETDLDTLPERADVVSKWWYRWQQHRARLAEVSDAISGNDDDFAPPSLTPTVTYSEPEPVAA